MCRRAGVTSARGVERRAGGADGASAAVMISAGIDGGGAMDEADGGV